ncbi:MAG: DUF357 domain-containing protein [Candidatus Micrarchaeota archaeon]|nr:DUF357 domain-containing protein [Candidatus Micrarchaeota archaeon]
MNKKEEQKNIKRIMQDIEQFYKNLEEVDKNPSNFYIIDLATKYCQDASYWLKKGDLFTAFGCINYAHGLLDVFRLKQESKTNKTF